MRQIFYVRPQEDRSWVVSRSGRTIIETDTPDDALDQGDRIARKAASGGLETELRLAQPDRSYWLCGVFDASSDL